jgi:hypothetical protein
MPSPGIHASGKVRGVEFAAMRDPHFPTAAPNAMDFRSKASDTSRIASATAPLGNVLQKVTRIIAGGCRARDLLAAVPHSLPAIALVDKLGNTAALLKPVTAQVAW